MENVPFSVIYALPCQIDTVVAEDTRKLVQAEEAKASEKARFAANIQKELDKDLLTLDRVLNSLKSVNKKDITEVRDLNDGQLNIFLK